MAEEGKDELLLGGRVKVSDPRTRPSAPPASRLLRQRGRGPGEGRPQGRGAGGRRQGRPRTTDGGSVNMKALKKFRERPWLSPPQNTTKV